MPLAKRAPAPRRPRASSAAQRRLVERRARLPQQLRVERRQPLEQRLPRRRRAAPPAVARAASSSRDTRSISASNVVAERAARARRRQPQRRRARDARAATVRCLGACRTAAWRSTSTDADARQSPAATRRTRRARRLRRSRSAPAAAAAPCGSSARSSDRCPRSATLSGTPCAAQPDTSSNDGPTTRIRWPSFFRQR